MADPTTTHPDRRAFLAAAGASASVLMAGTAGCTAGTSSRGPMFEISLAEWSLHRTLRSGQLDNLGFPERARGFGIDAVEYVNTFFQDKARDSGYLAELRRRCDAAGIQSVLIMCDGEGALGDPLAKARDQAVRNHQQWVEAAKALGCHSIRVNAQSIGTWEEQQKLAADGLRALCEYGDKHDIDVIVENHGGLSSNGKWLAGTLAKVEHKRIGALPDFGNFRVSDKEEYDRYQGVDELMPFARGVSAKSHDFDKDGNETRTDYMRMLEIVLVKHRYSGFLGVEYEGDKLSEDDGIVATKKLCERVHGKMQLKLAKEAIFGEKKDGERKDGK
jgi:sugar phosphate isomerase/epimerase